MKKKMLLGLLFGLLVVGPMTSQTVAATTDLTIEEDQRASLIAFRFKSYPPKTYRGMVLVRVDTVKGGYVGWYV